MAEFKPGKSGNPRGRPRRTDTEKALRKKISEAAPGIIDRLLEASEEGDVSASKLLLERAVPALKPTDQPVHLHLTGEVADDGRAALAALAGGQITPSEGASILSAITSLQRVLEGSEILERLEKLEAAIHDNASTDKAD